MNYTNGKALKCVPSPDGSRILEIVARDDGLFQAHEFCRISADEGGGWTVGRVSGLFESAETAESAARAIFKM
jgi:hypothetical protein